MGSPFRLKTVVGTPVELVGSGYAGCRVMAVHSDGTYDVKVPGVGLHQRVPHADLRLRDGGGMLPILALPHTVPVSLSGEF